MPTFTIPEDQAGLRFRAGGRDYVFNGSSLEVEFEADASRIRTYALENPGRKIAEDKRVVKERPAKREPSGTTTVDTVDTKPQG